MIPRELMSIAPSLRGKRILLGVTGSIAAFKACDLVRYLRQCDAEVRVVLTESGEKFVTPLTLETLSGHRVLTSLWTGELGNHHIDTARWADVALVAPATANTLAKLAHGIADDLLTTELLALKCPLAVAPAMNPAMFSNPATQANLSTLRARGVHVIGPVIGVTSCGEEGLGRMAEPEAILSYLARIVRCEDPNKKSKRALINLGPTRSPIDPVRYLSNRSSGKMGAALVWEAWLQGHSVTAVVGPVDVTLPPGIQVIRTTTANEMLGACEAEFSLCDLFIASAAILDWEVEQVAGQKIKKGAPPPLALRTNPDILATLAKQKQSHQRVVGFAAETEAVLSSAKAKLLQKNCDALFANDVSSGEQGFDRDLNGGWWITLQEATLVSTRTKTTLAAEMLRRIEQLYVD